MKNYQIPAYQVIFGTGIILVVLLLTIAIPTQKHSSEIKIGSESSELEIKFASLSKARTNSCGGGANVVYSMPENGNLQGSCCSPMDLHRYEEQIEGLKRYSSYDIIPSDPYDVPVVWARETIDYNKNTQLTAEQQAIYDEAVEMSHEGGPCCCICWHWYAYEGLAKKLIIEYGFSAEQIAEVWDLSDACGGDGHAHGQGHGH